MFSVLLVAAPLAAQTAPPGAGGTQPTQPATAPTTAPSPLNFSGVIFGSYNYQLPTTPAQLSGQISNSFIVDRAYLTFRMPAGDHVSIRITTDVYQTSDTPNNAYTIRAKYAFLQYDGSKFKNGAQVTGRLGILQNVIVDHEENFWPRYLSQVPTERTGFFASADAGLAGLVTLPNKMGEIYTTIVNGPGYTARERDRFKDFAARLTLTPLMSRTDLLQTLTFTAWGYKGALASSFVNGGTGQIGAVGEALDRSRAGVLVGIHDPRLVLGGEFAARHDDSETGLNTAVAPRAVTEATGHLLSAFGQIRPMAFADPKGKSPWGLVARYDHVTPTASTTGFATAPSSSNAYHVLIGGLFWDLSQKAQLALDYQESLATANGVSNAPPTQSKAYFAHFVVNF